MRKSSKQILYHRAYCVDTATHYSICAREVNTSQQQKQRFNTHARLNWERDGETADGHIANMSAIFLCISNQFRLGVKFENEPEKVTNSLVWLVQHP